MLAFIWTTNPVFDRGFGSFTPLIWTLEQRLALAHRILLQLFIFGTTIADKKEFKIKTAMPKERKSSLELKRRNSKS